MKDFWKHIGFVPRRTKTKQSTYVLGKLEPGKAVAYGVMCAKCGSPDVMIGIEDWVNPVCAECWERWKWG